MNQYVISLEEVITYKNYFESLRKCNRSVNYKYSVQSYNDRCALRIAETINTIKHGRIPEVKKPKLITIFERGKKRTITPIDICDRITQKVLCDKVLIPSIEPHLIYDNGASMKYKGTNFSRSRFEIFLEDAKKKYGWKNVYALTFDFKSYFDSIPHIACYNVLKKYLSDERLVNLTIGIIESYKLPAIKKIKNQEDRERALERLHNHEYVGICLGSQISQIMAVAVPNDFDHYIKDVLGCKYYVRHMDDGIILSDNKEDLIRIKKLLEKKLKEIGLTFNAKKTMIVNLTKGVTFLKVKYHLMNGKTVKRLVRSGIVRERRKLKKFKPMVENHHMTLDDVYSNMQSWISHSKIAKCYQTTKNMIKLYNKLYGGYKITKAYYKANPTIKRKKKVVRL